MTSVGAEGFRTIELVEQTEIRIQADALGESEAVAVAQDKLARVRVEWPTPLNSRNWVLKATGWVGSLPVGPKLMLRIAPKLPVARVFELLDRANRASTFREFEGLTTGGSDTGLCDTLVDLLERKVSARLARGLYRGYRTETRIGQSPRGRIRVLRTARQFASGRPNFVFETNTISEDVEDNRIIAWTLDLASSLPFASAELAQRVRSTARRLASSIALVPFDAADCQERPYDRQKLDYRGLHGLCAMILSAKARSLDAGGTAFSPFGVWMPELFEVALIQTIARSLPPALSIRPGQIYSFGEDKTYRFEMDGVIRTSDGTAVAVVEAKYKLGAKISPDEIQQVVAYAAALGAPLALLVYAADQDDRRPMRVGNVTVCPLHFDLDLPIETAGARLKLAVEKTLAGSPHSTAK